MRRSGDLWTSAFNSLLNVLIVMYVFDYTWDSDFKMLVLGDDNVVASQIDLSDDVIVTKYKELGMDVKIIRHDSMETASFCSGRFWKVDGVYRWGVSPFRIMSKFGMNYNNHHKKFWQRLNYGRARGLLPVAGHIPILGSLLRAICDSAEDLGLKPHYDHKELNPYRIQGGTVCYPGYDTYQQFSIMYNISIDTIFEIEEMIECTFSINDMPCQVVDKDLIRMMQQELNIDEAVENEKLSYHDHYSQEEYNYQTVCVDGPRDEEYAKLVGVTNIVDAWSSGWNYGLEEDNWYMSNPDYGYDPKLRFHHALWSACGFINPDWAISMHMAYNHRGWIDGGVLGNRASKGLSTSRTDHHWFVCPNAPVIQPQEFAIVQTRYPVFVNASVSVSYIVEEKLPIFANKKSKNLGKEVARLKKQVKGAKKKKPNKKPKSKAGKTPLRKFLEAGGQAVGSYFGPAAGAYGSKAGAWVSKLIGSGDYKIRNNSIMDGQGVPNFLGTGRGVRIRHKEFLGDLFGSTNFNLEYFYLNPGMAETFPWLSEIAHNFTTYKFHGLVFCYNSMSADALNSTNTALGSITMATNYNVLQNPFLSKSEMDNYEFTCSTRPSASLMHPVECAQSQQPLRELYIRHGQLGGVEDDLRFSDWGLFQIATKDQQASSNMGELWVTYDVEFFKPRITSTPGIGQYAYVKVATYDNTNVFGTGAASNLYYGSISVTLLAGALTLNGVFPGTYFIHIQWAGSSAVINLGTVSYFDCSPNSSYYVGDATGASQAPSNGVTANKLCYSTYLAVTNSGVGGVGGAILNIAASTLPASGTGLTVYIAPVATVPSEEW